MFLRKKQNRLVGLLRELNDAVASTSSSAGKGAMVGASFGGGVGVLNYKDRSRSARNETVGEYAGTAAVVYGIIGGALGATYGLGKYIRGAKLG